jgi:hypothetical protein
MKIGRIQALFLWASAILLGTAGAAIVRSPWQADNSYDALLSLFREFREFQKPRIAENGVPDYTPAAMAAQKTRLPEFQKRLAAISSRPWPIARRVDYEIVRAEMNGLEFDHRILRPWSRDPGFYAVIQNSEPDVPAREGAEIHGCLNLFEYTFPLDDRSKGPFQKKLAAIPGILAQAKSNLIEDARDLWRLGARQKKNEAASLDRLGERLAVANPDLVPIVKQARAAVDDFRAWLEAGIPALKGPSGIGKTEYDWYQKFVHLVPYSWDEHYQIARRELERSLASLKLEEHRNRKLPPLQPPATREELQQRQAAAVSALFDFFRSNEIFTVPDYMKLNAGGGNLVAADRRDFFTQIDYRDALPLKVHSIHWLEKQREARNTHPIRGTALLYNIWDSRAEGFATAAEELFMHAGLLDKNPRARELVYVLLAFRAVRAICDLKLHAREWTVDDAIKYAAATTPYGWVKADGDTIWGDLTIYLHGPGYGTSYVTGKIQVEGLLADCARLQGEAFTLKSFLDEMFSKGLIPASLIRWEMTGLEDEMRKLGR